MNITIVQTFTDGFTTYQSGQELSVPSEVAQRWIADGKAQADTDGQQSWLSSTEVAATRALVSEYGGPLVRPGEMLRKISTVMADTTLTTGAGSILLTNATRTLSDDYARFGRHGLTHK